MSATFTGPIPFAELSDGDLTLRALRTTDAEDIYLCSIDERMQAHTLVPGNYTREMARDFVTEQTENIKFALQYDAFGNRYCGCIEARLLDASIPAVSLGYNTAPWARGLGLQTRALQLISAYGFRHGIHRIEVRIATDNVASRHVAESAGYQLEGIMRHGMNFKGKLQDVVVYAKLSTD